jgi:hypothetical protein
MYLKLLNTIVFLLCIKTASVFAEEVNDENRVIKFALTYSTGRIITGEFICKLSNKGCRQLLGDNFALSIKHTKDKNLEVRLRNNYSRCCILSDGKEKQFKFDDTNSKIYQLDQNIIQINLFEGGSYFTTLNRQRGKFVGKITLVIAYQ